MLRASMLFVTLLLGCTRYSCGTYVVDTPLYGQIEGGEWCGLFGSYAFHYTDTDRVEVLITPESANEEVNGELLDVLAVGTLRFPVTSLVEGAVITDAEAGCGLAPYGVLSGSFVVQPATGTLTVGARGERTLTGLYNHEMSWDFTCADSRFSGSDRVEIDEWTEY